MLRKSLIIALIIINLVLIGWFMANPEKPVVTQAAEISGTASGQPRNNEQVPQLKLLREVSQLDMALNRCATIGPLSSPTMVRRLRERLTAYTSRIRERQTEARVERGFWVYLPVAESREAAIEFANQLGSMGINDYFVVTSGEMQNAVSLGLFNDLPNAEKRQQQLQALGFNPHLGARREYETHYWLDYQLLDDVQSPWKSLARSADGARRFQIQCWEDNKPADIEAIPEN